MVVLIFKNLQQQTFSVEIDISAKVKELKEKIEKEKGKEYPAIGQKIIYTGKILQDENTLESYNIDEKKFLVIMVTKPKSPLPPSGPTDPTAAVSVPIEEDTSEESVAGTQSVPSTSPTIETSSSSSTTTSSESNTTTASITAPESEHFCAREGTAESVLVTGQEFNRMVENIMEMGYNRQQVERALRASFNNPYTAVQYLVDGIPPSLDIGDNPPAEVPQESQEGGEATEGDEEDPLAFLREQTQFSQMRQLIRSNPQLLDAVIQQIGATNPQLLQVIQQNQEAFVRMLNEPLPGEGSGGRAGQGTGGGGGRERAPGRTAITVSPQDRVAIDRLIALGNFPEDVVIQAYFACEKNENLAAEFLFSQSWD